jgi:hypothetical protein
VLPTRARRCVDKVLWHSPPCCVACFGSGAPSTSPPLAAKGQRHACVASTRGRRSNRSLCRLRPRMRTLLTGHGRVLAAKAEPSHPPSTHATIKGTFPVHFVCAADLLSVGKSPPHFSRSMFAAADVDSPPHCLSLPLCRSRGPFTT